VYATITVNKNVVLKLEVSVSNLLILRNQNTDDPSLANDTHVFSLFARATCNFGGKYHYSTVPKVEVSRMDFLFTWAEISNLYVLSPIPAPTYYTSCIHQ
jgi:hypothetical protein